MIFTGIIYLSSEKKLLWLINSQNDWWLTILVDHVLYASCFFKVHYQFAIGTVTHNSIAIIYYEAGFLWGSISINHLAIWTFFIVLKVSTKILKVSTKKVVID